MIPYLSLNFDSEDSISSCYTSMEEVRRLSAFTALLLLLVIGVIHSSVPGAAAASSSCPSTGQLASACAQYVIGRNPPVPGYNGGCCLMLRSAPPSCLCKSIPSNAGSVISKNAIANVRKGCRISDINCPGIGN